MEYISYKMIPSMWGLKKGDVVMVSSDITGLFSSCLEHGEKFDINVFIDEIIKVIGPEGTLLFPTYSWSFCKGETFDYFKTACKTGALGTIALKRKDFKRSKHPIYSFAVVGKYQDLICGMNNTESWGQDSPFAFFEKIKAKNVIIDCQYNDCFTFVHYVEQTTGVPYRYHKNFTADYIDENGDVSQRTYSMYVRDYDLDADTDMTEMGKELEEKGISKVFLINNICYRVVDLAASFKPIEEDIKFNNCKKISYFIGQ